MNNNTDNIDTDKLNEYLNCIDIIYWINLDRSTERRKNMENILKNIKIPNKRINAVDGKILPDYQIYNRFNGLNNMSTKIEYACLLSHLDTIKMFANSQYTNALIFEDDISLEYIKFWNKTVCEIIKNAPNDWDIIMLNYMSHQNLTKLYTENINGDISSCQSYIINKKGAQKLMNQILFLDGRYKLNKNFTQTADNYIFSSLKTYVYKYPYFTYPIENDSTIHNSHLDYHRYGKLLALMRWKEMYNFKLGKNYENILIQNKLNKKYDKILFSIILLLILFYVIMFFIENHENQNKHFLFYELN